MDTASVAWLGLDKSTEHAAPQGVVDQAALTPTPGAKPQAQSQPGPLASRAVPVQSPLSDSQAAAERREAASAALQELGVRPAPPTAAQPQPAAPAPPPAPASGNAGAPGLPSSAESTARAIEAAPVVKPGSVVAAEGLEIATRTPRWTTTTRLTRRPRNAVVEIAFARDGTVRSADFVTVRGRRYGSGFDDVDQPLLDAIYTWTAKGRALRELPDTPGAEVRIILTILLG